ncbi:MAG: VWA domain-containing protein, partial [Thiotrichales bacterium]|nr:VWA domain-containing protein [Thiotrichales bacterium]
LLALCLCLPVFAQADEPVDAAQAETERLLEQARSYLEPAGEESGVVAEAVDAESVVEVESPLADVTDSAAQTGAVISETLESVTETEAAPDAVTENVTDASATLLLVEEGTTAADTLPKDMLLVLDNSGSMKKNDPQFLTNQAVREFIAGLDEATRLGIIIFDQDVQLAVPFTEVTRDNSPTLLASLDLINYKGLYTDSPAAIERAIYELKNDGRQDAEKIIVFMTDGIVDTGQPDVDLEKTRWLKDNLAADAADSDITIFGIAFTDNADFQLIQSLAQKTDGEYYRALQAEDLTRVFEKIVTIINTPPEPEPVAAPPPPPPVAMPQPVAPPPPPPEPEIKIIEVPVERDTSEEDLRNKIMIISISAVLIALIAILILLMRRRGGAEPEAPAQEAFINDPQGFTDHATYKLGSKPTMLGRVPGKDTDHLNYIVIPQTTIGRRHALIEYKEFAFWIIDQGSINGTFVNDKPISTETRLKHGDRVRLHKYELEFTIPELAEDGMTVISNTVFAGADAQAPSADPSEDATVARAESADAPPQVDAGLDEPDFDLDFDMTSGVEGADDADGSEDVTALRDAGDSSATQTDVPAADLPEEGSDETIMLNDDDDIMNDDEDDATIRRKIEESKEPPEHFVETAEFNIKDQDDKK